MKNKEYDRDIPGQNDIPEGKVDHIEPVKAKAYLIDPETKSVIWMNESASEEMGTSGEGSGIGLELQKVFPLFRKMGLIDEMDHVAKTGNVRHFRTDLISTARGKMTVTASVYKLPNGNLLIISEIGWQAKKPEWGNRSPRK